MKDIAITPFYAKGKPIDVASLSLGRAEAVAKALTALHKNKVADDIPQERLHLLAMIVKDHISFAREHSRRCSLVPAPGHAGCLRRPLRCRTALKRNRMCGSAHTGADPLLDRRWYGADRRDWTIRQRNSAGSGYRPNPCVLCARSRSNVRRSRAGTGALDAHVGLRFGRLRSGLFEPYLLLACGNPHPLVGAAMLRGRLNRSPP